jgi:hypothetical protein
MLPSLGYPALDMEKVHSSETPVYFYQTIQCYIPENSALHIYEYLAFLPDYTALHSRKQCSAHLSCFSTRLHGGTFQKTVLCKFILLFYQTTRRYIPENSALHTYLAFLPDYTALHSRKQCSAHLSCFSTRLHGVTFQKTVLCTCILLFYQTTRRYIPETLLSVHLSCFKLRLFTSEHWCYLWEVQMYLLGCSKQWGTRRLAWHI